MPGHRTLTARVWIAQVGRVPLLLLDSDIAENDEELRGVTDRLYGGDQDHRIKQEILAGVGGVRAVRAYTRIAGLPDPEVFHMNEGHAGFLGAERIRELVTGAGLDFDEALAAVRAGTVFTTHTPVPAGIDRFPAELVRHYFSGPNGENESALLPGLGVDRILALGRESDSRVFNMAHLGLRLGQRCNGVSKLHGRVSREMFVDLWPGFDAGEVPIGSVTNGVHAHTWAAREWLEFANRLAGPDRVEEAKGWELLQTVEPRELWVTRNTLRAQLVEEIRRRLRRSWLQRGATEAELGWVDGVFDPHVLTVGFARRVPTYKRLTLMLRDPERLRALLLDEDRPVQLVVAGKSHPADDGGKALIQQVVRFADAADVRHRIVFLPDYDMSMARYLYWGCDVWLNNPLRPLEACGTSGMKSALNGGLNLSIRDGWWDEMYDGENGWAIPTADGVMDEHRRDDLEASALYELLERSVLPRFYDRDGSGVPRRWIEMVRHTLQNLGPKVLASRMVRDYTVQYYAPAAAAAREAVADGFAGGAAARPLPAPRRGRVAGRAGGPGRQRRTAGHPGDRVQAGPDRPRVPRWSPCRRRGRAGGRRPGRTRRHPVRRGDGADAAHGHGSAGRGLRGRGRAADGRVGRLHGAGASAPRAARVGRRTRQGRARLAGPQLGVRGPLASSRTRAASRACRATAGEPEIAAVAMAPLARIASWSPSAGGLPASATSPRR